MRAGLLGVNTSRTLSSYSRDMSSFEAKRRMLIAVFVTEIPNSLSKSVFSADKDFN